MPKWHAHSRVLDFFGTTPKRFVGIIFPYVQKLQKEFIGQMFFGIQAGQTAVHSRIVRELKEDILLKKTEERS